MSSSGLIYAVIVGAWAAYLVPMWLRRQDELNEARPTERFSTAIRLLSGRSAMERRYAKELRQRATEEAAPEADPENPADALTEPLATAGEPAGVSGREFSVPQARGRRPATPERGERQGHPESQGQQGSQGHPGSQGHLGQQVPQNHQGHPGPGSQDRRQGRHDERREHVSGEPARRERGAGPAGGAASAAGRAASAERARRAQRSAVLARRRRTTVILFLAFTLGAIVAAVGGLGFLWAPAVPAALLSAYIVHLRIQERRRFAFTMDRRRAEAAAQRLRESRPRARATAPGVEADDEAESHHPAPVPEPAPAPALSPQEAGRRALVEQTDHAEWVDQQRERGPEHGASWDPVPVPLPTYVTAPVAPRATGSIDLGAPDTWSSARSSTADPTPTPEPAPAAEEPPRQRSGSSRRRTPLFDQYADDDRPRAANE
ncbi:gephyrin-like molybdotransferase receptor GlpR [Streptomyces sp. NPDC048361]|uniref:divisome protein SepX/GlpR n=1 Tax=Streptomyces sp. NPDC048361 TaxID=3154720 RepID=UPI003416127D